jgi:hypothetical protein
MIFSRLPAAGNYSYTDLFPVTATTYHYRVKVVEQNGNISYSNVVILTKSASTTTAGLVKIRTNPFKDVIQLEINAVSIQPMSFTLFDATGRTVYRANKALKIGDNLVSLTLTNGLAAGAYIMRISSPEFNKTFRIVKAQ